MSLLDSDLRGLGLPLTHNERKVAIKLVVPVLSNYFNATLWWVGSDSNSLYINDPNGYDSRAQKFPLPYPAPQSIEDLCQQATKTLVKSHGAKVPHYDAEILENAKPAMAHVLFHRDTYKTPDRYNGIPGVDLSFSVTEMKFCTGATSREHAHIHELEYQANTWEELRKEAEFYIQAFADVYAACPSLPVELWWNKWFSEQLLTREYVRKQSEQAKLLGHTAMTLVNEGKNPNEALSVALSVLA